MLAIADYFLRHNIPLRVVPDALRAVEITLMDHIIVSDGDFVSMEQSGFLR